MINGSVAVFSLPMRDGNLLEGVLGLGGTMSF